MQIIFSQFFRISSTYSFNANRYVCCLLQRVKHFVHSIYFLVSGLNKKESPISQREKELLEKEAKIIEFENMVRETVLRAKQVNLYVICVKSLLNPETRAYFSLL